MKTVMHPSRWVHSLWAGTAFALASLSVQAANLQPGPVQLKSTGPLAVTDTGVLLVGDPMAAAIYAIDPEAKKVEGGTNALQIDDLQSEIAKATGFSSDQIRIGDLVTNPKDQHFYLSVAAGDEVAIVSVSPAGSVTKLNLDKVMHAKKSLPNPPEDRTVNDGRRQRNPRAESITDLAFFEGKVLVSGLSATEAPSSVMEIPYPFTEETILTNVEIFHAAHGRVETPAIRTFVTMNIDGEPSVLAGFTCTPLVAFPLDKMGSKEKVRGKTLAELGNRNQPLDMIPYERDGKPYLLMSNSARGMMKVSLSDVEKNPGLTEPVRGGGTAGQPYETVAGLDNVIQMDRFDATHAIVIKNVDGKLSLNTIELP